ncbi:MAG: hypothetical protein ACFFDY_09480 [Candidatus Thorarchaeota archaeon]
MHINSHFAVGFIFASILNYIFNFNLLEFSLIVIFSFVCDFDIFFSKYAKNNNHRLLITHSIIPSVIMLLIGLILNWTVLIISAISYFTHIIIDTLDWGTNLLYFQQKQVGFKFLISKEEFENLSQYLSEYKNPLSFFDAKYYNNKILLIIEIILFILMVVMGILFAFRFLFLTLLYFLFIWFHLSRHFHLKKIEKKG